MNEEEFQRALDQLGWTQADLARKIGIAPESVSRMRKAPPKYVTAYLETMLSTKRIRELASRVLRA